MKPFRFKLDNNSFLSGIDTCPKCLKLWLHERKVNCDDASELTGKEKEGIWENKIGEPSIQLKHNYREAHPKCGCNTKYPEPDWYKEPNAAFSSVFQVKCERYGTPTGNLWHFKASRPGKSVAVSHPDKHEARRRAVLGDIRALPYRPFFIPKIGAWDERHCNVRPMLVVGTNNYIRQRVPHSILQQYDLYITYFPQNKAYYHVALIAIPRGIPNSGTLYAHSKQSTPEKAIAECIYSLVAQTSSKEIGFKTSDKTKQKASEQLFNRWIGVWIYRLSKISLKDVLQLSEHKKAA